MERSVHEYPSLPRFPAALAHLYGVSAANVKPARYSTRCWREISPMSTSTPEWLFTISLLAGPCSLLDDRDAAERIHSLLLPYERLYAHAPVESVFGAVARSLGVLATTMERYDDAEQHFAVAIEVEQAMRARPWSGARPARSRDHAARPRCGQRLRASAGSSRRGCDRVHRARHACAGPPGRSLPHENNCLRHRSQYVYIHNVLWHNGRVAAKQIVNPFRFGPLALGRRIHRSRGRARRAWWPTPGTARTSCLRPSSLRQVLARLAGSPGADQGGRAGRAGGPDAHADRDQFAAKLARTIHEDLASRLWNVRSG